MNELLTAIYDKVTATPHNDFYNAIGGRFYAYFAPQDVTYPCAVVFVLGESYDYQFDATNEQETCLVQFNIFSDDQSPEEVGDVFNKLKTLFDWCSLSVSGYTHLYTRREFAVRTWLDDSQLWQYSVQYRIGLEKA